MQLAVAGRGAAMVGYLVLLVLPQYLQEHLLLTTVQTLGPLARLEGTGAIIITLTAAAAAGLVVTVLMAVTVVLMHPLARLEPEVPQAEGEAVPVFFI